MKQLAAAGGLEIDAAVTTLVGENGTGKSTLVEAPVALARAFLDAPGRFLHHLLTD